MCAALATLKSSSDFQRVSKTGRKFHAPGFIMLAAKTEQPFRLGLTASRKVGNAVVRNRAKRRLREVVRTFGVEKLDKLEIVLIAKTAASDRDFAAMQADFAKGVKEVMA